MPKFNTDNSIAFGRNLYVKSMSKLHHVDYLVSEKQEAKKLFSKNFIAVALMPFYEDVSLLANTYGGDNKINLSDFNSVEKSYTNCYLQAYGKFYQIAFITNSVEEANTFCIARPDVGVIDTTRMELPKPYTKPFHFVASIEPSKVN